MIITLLAYFGIGALIGVLTTIVLTLVTWLVKTAVKAIAGLIRKIGERIAVVRKKKAMKRILDAMSKELNKASKNERDAIEDALNNLQECCEAQGTAFVVPRDANGDEHWEKVQVIQAEDAAQDDMSDTVVVTHEEKYAFVRM